MVFYLLIIYQRLKKDMIIKKLKTIKKNLIKLYYKLNGIKYYFYGNTFVCCSNIKKLYKSNHKILVFILNHLKKKIEDKKFILRLFINFLKKKIIDVKHP